MMFYSQLSQVFLYSGTLSNRPPSGTLLLRRLQVGKKKLKNSSIWVTKWRIENEDIHISDEIGHRQDA
jgi:hypothetical protein